MEKISFKKCTDRLLDLGKRNRLLFFRYSTKQLPMLSNDIYTIFSKLTVSGELLAFDIDQYLEEKELDFFALTQEEGKEEIPAILSSIGGNEVLCYSPSTRIPTGKAIKSIKKDAKTALEERGINILYASFGFLTWYESQDQNNPIKTPLLFIPVDIKEKSNRIHIMPAGGDVMTNPTLFYKLQKDYNIKLPSFDALDDLYSYLEKVKKLIAPYDRWEISPEASIGLFSFSKIDMYEDLLANKKKALENPIVSALFGNDDGDPIDVLDSDDIKVGKNIELELHNILDADSSQMTAIALAKAGKSMVLEGPPGTGKSQTIANIIGECLYDGKTVLFVSEKKAALDVVAKKLQDANLGTFTEVIHGTGINKSAFHEDLRSARTEAHMAPQQRYFEEYPKTLKAEKDELDSYAEALNRPIPELSNKSLYSLIWEASKYADAADVPFFLEDFGPNQSIDFLQDFQSIFREIGELLPKLSGKYNESPFYGWDATAPLNNNRFKVVLSKVSPELEKTIDQLGTYDPFGLASVNPQNLHKALDAVNAIKSSRVLNLDFFSHPDRKRLLDIGNEYAQVYIRKKAAYERLRESADIEDVDEALYKETRKFLKTYSTFTIRLSPEYREARKPYLDMSIEKGKGYRIIKKIATGIVSYYEAKKAEESHRESFDESFTNRDEIRKNIETFKSDLDAFAPFTDLKLPGLTTIDEKSFETAKSYYKLPKVDVSPLTEVLETLKPYFADKSWLSELGIKEIGDRVQAMKSNFNELEDYVRIARLMKKVEEQGHMGFISAYLESGLPYSGMVDSFSKIFYSQWIDHIKESDPALRDLLRDKHDHLVSEYQKEDKSRLKTNRRMIRQNVFYREVPTDESNWKAFYSFEREIMKQRSLQSIRQMMDAYAPFILRMKPCFMMSPLSVSRNLGPDVSFDVVIFDEASQVYPWDAIGAIYRSKQAIIVGDNKQLPPTNFFQTITEEDSEDDEEDPAADIDYESILDFFKGVCIDKRLLWHYRSQNEELISFSNKNFYDNSLITFPSVWPSSNGGGIKFTYVSNGYFVRKGKFNPVEAHQLVSLVREQIIKHPDQSVGIVTFNVGQQDEIDTAIDNLLATDQAFSRAYQKAPEDLFVKNLETVQGDERDVIFISIGYAPDKDGRFYMNFGPLNRRGGERRLNVAITRARKTVHVVSSIRHFDIDLSKTSAVGPRLLKEYLEFAETKKIMADSSSSVVALESPFEEEVYDFLKESGYRVETQVGSSKYRIDLGIKHPEKDLFVLAIECDGATYHSMKSARDRDRLRQSVLESKGWSFYRIWSTDWFYHKSDEKARLLDAVNKAIEESNRKIKEPVPDKPIPEEPKSEEPIKERSETRRTFEIVEDTGYVPPKPVYTRKPVLSVDRYKGAFKEYEPYETHARHSEIEAGELALEVISKEGPVTEDFLAKRVSKFCGRGRSSEIFKNSMLDRLNGYYYDRFKKEKDLDGKNVYYIEGGRYKVRKAGDRMFSEIPLIELQEGLLEIANIDDGRLNRDEIRSVLIKTLGFQKETSNMIVTINDCLDGLIAKNLLEENQWGIISWVKNKTNG